MATVLLALKDGVDAHIEWKFKLRLGEYSGGNRIMLHSSVHAGTPLGRIVNSVKDTTALVSRALVLVTLEVCLGSSSSYPFVFSFLINDRSAQGETEKKFFEEDATNCLWTGRRWLCCPLYRMFKLARTRKSEKVGRQRLAVPTTAEHHKRRMPNPELLSSIGISDVRKSFGARMVMRFPLQTP
nr:hypothetical protein Iba_chr04aCG20240 [Ipomoea batatas]